MKIASISIADYSECTEGMPHDVERLYFRMLLKMLSREGGLPDDDTDNARVFGYRDVRTYRSLKAKLLTWPDAIRIDGDLIVNDRVESDIKIYRQRRSEAVENGRAGGKASGEVRAISRRSPIDLSLISDRSQPDLASISDRSQVDLEPIPHATNQEINDLDEPSPTPSPRSKEREEEVGFVANATCTPLEALSVFNSYNEIAQEVGLPVARSMTPGRRKQILARLKAHGGFSAWETVSENIKRSAFLQGKNDRNWKPTGLDWFLIEANFTKVLEGGYGNGAHATPKPKKADWFPSRYGLGGYRA